MTRPGRRRRAHRSPAAAGVRASAIVAVAAAGLLAACGVDGEGSARLEPDDQVPYGLLDSTTTTARPAAGRPGDPSVSLCFVLDGDDRLAEVGRPVPGSATAAGVLDALAGGPTEDEAALGLSTALPDDAFGDEATSSGGVVSVDLDPAFADSSGTRQLLAVAQVVCTLTARPGVGQVAFTLDGAPVEVPREDGAATSAPVARDDYRTMLPR